METSATSSLRDVKDPRPMVVASSAMRDLLEFARRVAAGDAKVLITGETGVGKDVLASHIHRNSRRRQAEYVAVNCAGVTESLLESELFGHGKNGIKSGVIVNRQDRSESLLSTYRPTASRRSRPNQEVLYESRTVRPSRSETRQRE